ncbi:unnamed protein product [Arabis nemorensis]|uniref:Uncharacterized protein n=1 Tax=Arabis nemorensis TaxID=586526 RepID=A0A565BF53_9BRAS|nr:unnamed protein product [Arabis nemorensis]
MAVQATLGGPGVWLLHLARIRIFQDFSWTNRRALTRVYRGIGLLSDGYSLLGMPIPRWKLLLSIPCVSISSVWISVKVVFLSLSFVSPSLRLQDMAYDWIRFEFFSVTRRPDV